MRGAGPHSAHACLLSSDFVISLRDNVSFAGGFVLLLVFPLAVS